MRCQADEHGEPRLRGIGSAMCSIGLINKRKTIMREQFLQLRKGSFKLCYVSEPTVPKLIPNLIIMAIKPFEENASRFPTSSGSLTEGNFYIASSLQGLAVNFLYVATR